MTKDESSDVGQGNSCLAQGSDFKTDIAAIFDVFCVTCVPLHSSDGDSARTWAGHTGLSRFGDWSLMLVWMPLAGSIWCSTINCSQGSSWGEIARTHGATVISNPWNYCEHKGIRKNKC